MLTNSAFSETTSGVWISATGNEWEAAVAEKGQFLTIAFGGRVVGDADGPKYVNTSETRYFHKGRVIYALDRAIDSVRRTGHIVSGHVDCRLSGQCMDLC